MKEQQIFRGLMPKQENAQSQNHSGLDNDKDCKSYESLSNWSNSCASGPQDSFDSVEHKRSHFTPSLISYTMHRNKKSVDISEFHDESEPIRMDDFFDDQIILQRKVQKKDVVFKKSCFHQDFMKNASEEIFKFTQNPTDQSFSLLISRLFKPDLNLFKDQFLQEENTLLQIFEDLFYRQKHTFIVYTFDWNICHLTFVCLLIIYWVRIDCAELDEMRIDSGSSPEQLKKITYIQNEHKKLRYNLNYVTRLYISERSQQINTNQVILILIYYFLNLQKQYSFLELVEICNTQNKLISDIQLFRRIKRKEKQFNSTCNKVIFESQLYKYEHGNKLIESMDKTYTLLNLITSHNFVSTPLLKFYQLDEYKNSRKEYQNKKHNFSTWVFQILINLVKKQSAESLIKSALYIVHFMGLLKRMRESCNIEGMSYLIPILANIKIFLPKVWDFAIKKRPEISRKFQQHSEFLLKKFSKISQLGQKGAILWGQTIFELTEKMAKRATQQNIILEEHKVFYEHFLKDFSYFRKRVQQRYQEQIDNYDRDREIGSSFNMYLLDTYIPRVYTEKNKEEYWKGLEKTASEVNRKIVNSFYLDFMDYCFIGSTRKYSRIEI